jgi:hypothetical protein
VVVVLWPLNIMILATKLYIFCFAQFRFMCVDAVVTGKKFITFLFNCCAAIRRFPEFSRLQKNIF